MKRILVTGGAGFIGSHLVDRLAQEDSNRVRVIDNLRRGNLANLEGARAHIEFVKADIRDRAAVESAMEGVDLVYHLAAQSNVLGAVQDLDYSFATNVGGTLEVLRAAAKAGVKRVVFTSSREVYGDPDALPVVETAPLAPKNAYGASKAAGEMYCRVLAGKNFEIVVLRLANAYGSRDFDRVIPIFLNQALTGQPLTLYGGQQIIDFVSVATVVAGLIRAGEDNTIVGPINVGSGRATTVAQLAERILGETGSKCEIHVAPSREVEVSRFIASTAQMRQKLGLEPSADPLDRLKDLVDWTRARIGESQRLSVGIS